jgi:hypothetical protein
VVKIALQQEECSGKAQNYFVNFIDASEVLPGRLKGVIHQDEALVDGKEIQGAF